ncbi:MAG: glycosyltransferase family 2 protein, partial [Methylococcaceae bacterium]
MKISIVVPVHNEAENIVSLIREIENAMSQAEAYEIIYVDDGSKDHTPEVLKQALHDFKNLRVIHHQQSCGQSTAVHTGVKAARYPWIATLDGDGQNDPADIPNLYDVLIKQREAISN